MYNKIFTKILDSSIWLESDATRIIWVTLIAAMDEQGFTQFASIANLAHRARVSERAASASVKTLESPDKNSGDPDHEGRRIERVPGGWVVLNAAKYRELVTRAVSQQKTRERVAKFRAKKNPAKAACNASVTPANDSVTPSEAEAETRADRGRKESAPTSDSEWLKGLTGNPAYEGLNVPAEFGKMQAWCEANRKQATRRRFVNWLNRAERPIAGAPTRLQPKVEPPPAGWRERLEKLFPGNRINSESVSWELVDKATRKKIAC